MKAAEPTLAGPALSDGESCGRGDAAGQDADRALGPKFVEGVIRALIDLDAEHLEALAAAAERFREGAVLRMAPGEVAEMEAKLRLLSAFLTETRRNLRVFSATVGAPDPLGYKPGRGLWAD